MDNGARGAVVPNNSAMPFSRLLKFDDVAHVCGIMFVDEEEVSRVCVSAPNDRGNVRVVVRGLARRPSVSRLSEEGGHC